MCLIVYKNEPNQHFSNKHFKAMITRNDDGLGIMYRADGRVKVEKSVGTAEQKFQMFRRHRDRSHWAMHARFKTHGAIDEQNCHPYKIMDIDDGDPIDLYMMHNGVISNSPSINKEMSDTWHYIEYILKPILKADVNLLWENTHIQALFQEHIGKTNKLLFMRSDEVEYPVLILNYASGTERNGLWLSNTYSIETPRANYGYTNNNNNYNHNQPWNAHSYNTVHKDYLTEEKKSGIILQNNAAANTATNSALAPVAGQRPNYAVDQKNLEEGYIDYVLQLRGLSDSDIKAFIKEDPSEIADIILALYKKNTMPYSTLVNLCRTSPDDIVNILRNMAIEQNNNKKSA